MFVKCRFLDENKSPKGREYAYATNDEVVEGEIVTTQDGKEVVVTAIDVPQEAIVGLEDKLKYVSKSPPQDSDIIDSEATEIIIPDITIDSSNLVIIEQLPIITEQLKALSVEIDNITTFVLGMDCTEKNRQEVKKQRAKLNGLLNELEKRRIAVKKEILKPYDEFDENYKTYASEKLKDALKILDERIGFIENDIKEGLKSDAEGYFYEYSASKNIDWLTWEQSGIKVGISDNKTALKREVAKFIDKVSDDLALIETQEYKAEITVEYHKELNLAKAISTVQARVKAIAEQERLRTEQEERRKALDEQRRLQAEALEKARAGQAAVALEPPKQEAALSNNPTAQNKGQTSTVTGTEKTGSVVFKVTGTISELAALKKFMIDNEYEYIQIPLKSIREVS